jgi:8-oxo-dGTP pyrophosphatase MutT (NUDIX family)
MKEKPSKSLKEGRIRPIAIGIFRRNDEILVFEGYDPANDETFYRPLGGAIEFGEYGYQTLAREVNEEIGAEIENVRYLGLSENLFTFEGKAGHEIVLVYKGDLVGKAIYDQEEIVGREDNGSPLKVVWVSLERFRHGEAPLYPDGLLEFLLAQADPVDGGKNQARQGSGEPWHSSPQRAISAGIWRSPSSQRPLGEESPSERPHHDEK